MGAIYRHIPAKRRIPDYGLHGVLRVTICGISGMRDAVSAATGKFAAVVVRNFFQPILDVGRMAPKTVTKGRMAKGNDTANAKGNVRLECAAAVQLMRTWTREALIAVCLEEGGMNNKRVGGKPWGDVCRQWWDNFAKMCIYEWRTSWLSGADLGRLRDCSIAMGKAHLLWNGLSCCGHICRLTTCIFLPANAEISPNFHASPWKAATVGSSACCATAGA